MFQKGIKNVINHLKHKNIGMELEIRKSLIFLRLRRLLILKWVGATPY